MSCPHPQNARETTTRQVNEESQQTHTVCRLCGEALDIGLGEVPQWAT
jgi:Fe2+ or Zn2+ uptake regulation protein